MAEETLYRRYLSRAQLEVLAQYMERYPSLALAAVRSREGHVQARRTWDKIARTLNRIEDGVVKSGRDWGKYWIDLKHKIRRKYMRHQRWVSEGNGRLIQLGPIEQRIIKLLTDDHGNLLPTTSVYNQLQPYSVKCSKTKNSRISPTKPEQLVDTDPTVDDTDGNIDTADSTNQNNSSDYLILPLESLDQEADVKPNVHKNKAQPQDPIQILLPEENKSIDDVRRELVEFELKRQKDLHELEMQQRREKHELEVSILRIKTQIMLKELGKL